MTLEPHSTALMLACLSFLLLNYCLSFCRKITLHRSQQHFRTFSRVVCVCVWGGHIVQNGMFSIAKENIMASEGNLEWMAEKELQTIQRTFSFV